MLDGYNLIRRDADLQTAERRGLPEGRRALLVLVAGVARRTGQSFTVVFDGASIHGGEPRGGQVDVVFSRPPETADDVLVRLARQYRDGAVVVTSDRTVGDAAWRAGSTVLTADEFLDAAVAPEEMSDEPERQDTRDRGRARRVSREARAKERALRRLRGS